MIVSNTLRDERWFDGVVLVSHDNLQNYSSTSQKHIIDDWLWASISS